MIRGAAEQNDYFVRQRVEVRSTHNGHETWKDARIHQRSSHGCFVVYMEGPQSPHHIMFPDLRPMQPKPREHTPKVTKPLLSAEDIDAFNARVEEEERQRKASEPPPQKLVLVRREPEPEAQPASPVVEEPRHTRKSTPTPLSVAIRQGREGKGMMQKVLAERAKIRQPRLSRIEIGHAPPSDEELLEIAVVLDLDYDELEALRGLPPLAAAEPDRESGISHRAPEPQVLERVAPPPQQQTVDVERLLRQLDRLKEENTILRNTVVFYAGLER